MQPFEFALVLAGMLCAILLLVLPVSKTKWLISLPFALGGLVGAQLYVEGYRWHMLAAHIGIVISILVILFSSRLTVGLLKVLTAFSLMCFLVSAVAAESFPVFKFPALTGRYQVGTVTLEFEQSKGDTNNPTDEPGRRQLVVQLFYPAEASAQDRDSEYTLGGLATRFKPQLAKVRTRALINARIAQSEGHYPVVIYSHSFNGSRLEDLFLIQELASHGYVVACVDDPYDTPITVWADGRVLRHPGEHWLDFSSPQALQETLLRLKRSLAVRVADVSFVLDQLIRLDLNDVTSKFYGRLDTDHAGVVGFSFGGTTAAQACRADHRFKAGVDLDGYSFAVADADDIRRPFLIMAEGVAPDEVAAAHSPEQRAEASFDMIEYGKIVESYSGYLLTIKGTQHLNFSDFPLYSRLRFYTDAGPIDPRRAMNIINSYVVSFFEMNLRAKPAPLLEGPSTQFPEVEFVLRQRTATASNPQSRAKFTEHSTTGHWR
jgi:dienelactone hydrolase